MGFSNGRKLIELNRLAKSKVEENPPANAPSPRETEEGLPSITVSKTESRFCKHELHPAYQDLLKKCPNQLGQLKKVRRLQQIPSRIGQALLLYALPVSIVLELSLFVWDGSWLPITFADLIFISTWQMDLILDQPWFIVITFFAALCWTTTGVLDYWAQELEFKLDL